MANYTLSLITPNGKILEDSIESLSAPGVPGSFGVLAHHAPMVTLLREGTLEIQKEGQTKSFAIASGILEVKQDHSVLILTDSAKQK